MRTTAASLLTLAMALTGFSQAATAQTAPTEAAPIPTELKSYVQKPDDSYAYKLVKTQKVGACQGYIVELTSQTWQGIQWRHWLSILVPPSSGNSGDAVLAITGGRNSNTPPKGDSSTAQMLARVAEACQAPVAVLQQVPNQPLFDDLREDGLISYSFDRFLNGGDATWPLLLPMVKSAVKAMDATQSILKDQLHIDISKFVVTGASKRGWTTWLTAAVDPRVTAIAPMVIDLLNMPAQMKQQLASYGHFSKQIADYTQRGIISRMLTTPRGKTLDRLVDPFTYRALYTMPKLLLLGTNDPYWTVDAANLYVDQLPGRTMIHYSPNVGHGAGTEAISTLIAFVRSIVDGRPLPQLTWRHDGANTLHVQWKEPSASARLWQAHSDTRDFRQAHWTQTPIDGKDAGTAHVATPDKGWTAYFVQVTFPGLPPAMLSTQITVLPDRMPYPNAVKKFEKQAKADSNS